MRIRKRVSASLAVGVLGAAVAVPLVGIAAAPVAYANGCGGGGVPFWGGGGGCDIWTPAGNHVMCGSGYGAGNGGGGCKIEWGGDPANFTICDVTVSLTIPTPFGTIPVHTQNHDCPYVA